MHFIIVDTRTDRRRDGFAARETREAAERELAAAREAWVRGYEAGSRKTYREELDA